jgi:hypothetical protein
MEYPDYDGVVATAILPERITLSFASNLAPLTGANGAMYLYELPDVEPKTAEAIPAPHRPPAQLPAVTARGRQPILDISRKTA